MKADDWQDVKRIFNSALERDPAGRSEYLAEACCGDDELRGRVEELLTSYKTGFLENHGDVTPGPEKRALKTGDKIGRYDVVRLLGVGGMGEVYLARDESLDRLACIKVLSADGDTDRSQAERFIREAQSASALNHPHICTIYEINKDHDPPFIAMEYVEGRTLSERLDADKLEIPEAVDIALQVADGLAEAHEVGIVHRDIKPANILINKRGQVKIVDFGLARRFVASADDRTQKQITHSGMIIGTVSYMSPEQARGQAVDARSDIWSLAVVLCQMVTGRLPFAGDTISDTIASIIKSEPELPPGAIPPKLCAILRRALSKEKADRYESTRHFIADLQKLKSEDLLDRPDPNYATTITMPPPTEGTFPAITDEGNESRFPPGRFRYFTGIFAAIVIAAVAIWYAFSTTAGGVPVASVAVMPFLNATGDEGSEYLSDGLTESLIGRLSQLPKLSVKARSSVFRYKGKDVPLKQVGSELEVQAIINGRFLRNADQLTLYIELIDAATENVIWTRSYDRPAASLATLQGEVARDVVENLRQKLTGAEEQKLARSYTENAQAYQLYLKGRYHWDKRNEESYRIAEDAYKQAISLDPNYALAYAGLADLYLFRESDIGRQVAMPLAKQYALRALEIDDTLAVPHNTLAFVNENFDYDMRAAEAGFKRAIELNPNYAVAHQFYGGFLLQTGRTEEGLAEAKRAVDLEPYSAAMNWYLGTMLGFARRYDEAIEQQQKTLQLQPNYALAQGDLIGLYILSGRYNDAMALVEKTDQRRDNGQLAILLIKTGREPEARQVLKTMTDQCNARCGNMPYGIARTYAALGEKDEAFRWLNAGYDQRVFPMFFLRVDPFFDPLQGDPRFEELLQRIGLKGS